MIQKEITTELMEASGEYSVVTIFGPRQAGKTTLVHGGLGHEHRNGAGIE